MASSESAAAPVTLGTAGRATEETIGHTERETETTGDTTGYVAGKDTGRTIEGTDRLIGWWTKVHWGLLLAALVPLVIAGQGQHFLYDEWAFLGGKLDSVPLPDRYLLPHNEHWTLLPLLAYRGLKATVGVGSYWPYLGLLLLLHLAVAHVLWRLMLIAGSRPAVATALAAVFSVFGAAAQDLVWAFQIAFVGATLLGVTAVWLAVTGTASWPKTCLVAGLVVAALATAGVGLTYLVVVPLALVRRGLRYALVAFGLPLLVYLPWYAVYGASLTQHPALSVTTPLTVGAFVIFGMTAALTGYFGFGTNVFLMVLVGVPVLAGLIVSCRGFLARRTAAERAPLAMLVGALAFFGMAGLARAGYGLGTAASGRYIYVAMALLLPALAMVITGAVGQHRRVLKAVLPIALAVAVSNLVQLKTNAAEFRHHNDASRAVLAAASDLAKGPGPVFADQQPEPLMAPDLDVADLRSGHLEAAFEGVTPQPSDRLTASLNLQIRVATDPARAEAPTCQKHLQHRLSVTTSQQSTPRFSLSTPAVLMLSLKNAAGPPAERAVKLAAGTYVVESLREPGNLSVQAPSQTPSLAACQAAS